MIALRRIGRDMLLFVSLGMVALIIAACSLMPAAPEGPKIEILSPKSGETAYKNTAIEVQSVAIDDIRGALKVELWVDGQIYRIEEAPTKAGLPVLSVLQPWTPTTVGSHALTTIAETVDGRRTESKPVFVIVQERPTETPEATATFPPTATFTPVPPTATFTPPTPSATWTSVPPSPTPTSGLALLPWPPGAMTPSTGYPGGSGYPEYPGYPGSPGYPGGSGYPGYPGYPDQPGYSPLQPSMPVMPVPPMGDIQPEVAILSPQDGARIPLDREISIRVRATDDHALTRIEFLVDEAVFYAFEAAGQPFMDVVQTWRPTTPGVHVIDAIAFDDAWQASSPARIRVFVEGGGPVPMLTSWPPNPPYDPNPPQVYIESPASGTHVSGGQSIEVVVSASADAGVSGIELWADGNLIASESFPNPYQTRQWTTGWSSSSPGNHSLSARARDTAGNVGQSAPVTVVVQQPGPPPVGRIYFCSQQTGNLDIFSIRPDGSDLRQVTQSEFAETYPAVSRDGQMLAYEREGEIWVAQASGAGATPLIGSGDPLVETGRPAWSPDRQRIAFVQDSQIWVYQYAGGTSQPLTARGNIYDAPNYSPDGGQIACHSWQGGPDSSIYVLSAADGHVVRSFTSHPGADSLPVYSPDGSRIAFVRSAGVDSGIYVMSSDGSNVLRIVGHGWSPVWSPTGGKIAYVVPVGAQAELWTVNADGSGAVRVLGGVSLERIAWGP